MECTSEQSNSIKTLLWFRQRDAHCPFAMIPIPATRDSRLTHAEFHFLCALVGFATSNGQVNKGFSLEQIGKTIGTARRNAQRYLTKLIETGWVQRTLRPSQTSTLVLTLPREINANLNNVSPKRPPSQAKQDFKKQIGRSRFPDLQVPTSAPSGRTQEEWDALSERGRIRYMEILRRSE